jgi:hypothetical protein
MNDLMPWTQNDWYAAGSLLIRFGFLVAAVWFARNLLRTIRAFQGQVDALLKLSITSNSGGERISPNASVIAARSLGEVSPYWLPPQETYSPLFQEARFEEARANALVAAWHGLVHWLNEPMNTSRLSAWQRMLNWLQAPAGS